jgi:glucosamine-6-phosphate deaminase
MKVPLPQIETSDASLRPFGKARSGATTNKSDLAIEIHPDRTKMGAAAAARASMILRVAIADKGSARIILASSPSQNEFLAGLTCAPEIDWSRITIFHMDEFVGMQSHHPASFRKYQIEHVLLRIRAAAFHGLRGEDQDPFAECRRYSYLLSEAPIDFACLGIGENAHITFSDSHDVNFEGPRAIRVVQLDDRSRQQQVNNGCFPDLEAVPNQALSLTYPTLMGAKAVICVVPGAHKAPAVRAALHDPVSISCPATILRSHPNAVLYLDKDSASLL